MSVGSEWAAERDAAAARRLATGVTRGMSVARTILILGGVALCVVGGIVMLNDVSPKRYVGVVTWLIAAVILHDAVLAPILVAIGLGVVRAQRRISRAATTVIQAALIVGAVLTGLGVPGLVAQARGAGNYTVATNPYALALIGVWAVVAVVIAGTLVVSLVASRRRRARTK